MPRILTIRGLPVMLDTHLAILYGVKARRLREQVRRNRERFPSDFMLQLTDQEINELVSQNATPSRGALGGHAPLVFTQEGIAMLSGVLRSKRAVQVNIAIMRAFVRLRAAFTDAAVLTDLSKRVAATEKDLERLYRVVEGLVEHPAAPRKRIGFLE